MSSDPLSFFTAASSDDEDSSSENESDYKASSEAISDSLSKSKDAVLPPPLQALACAKTPDFVTSHLNDDLNWDNLVKRPPYVPPKELKPWESDLPAVETKSNIKDRRPDIVLAKQVPQTMTVQQEKPSDSASQAKSQSNIVDHAITWSKMYKSSNDSGPIKRPRPEDEDEDLVGFCHTDISDTKVAFQLKHQKTSESFRDKEKRKRNAGQANREKMFVEEEKRVLRQAFNENC